MNWLEEAISAFDRAIQSNPASAAAWLGKGEALLTGERPEEALPCFDVALRLDPRAAEAALGKARALQALGRAAEAVRMCEHAISIAPTAEAWLRKGECHLDAGDPARAITAFDSALRLDPKNAGIWWRKGKAEAEIGRTAEALSSFGQVVALAPEPVLRELARRRLRDLAVF